MRFAYPLPALLLLAVVAPAQTPEVVTKVDAKLDAERAAQRSEDVEVLRRLLNKSLGLADTTRVVSQPLSTWLTSTAGAWREISNEHASSGAKQLLEQVTPLEFKVADHTGGGVHAGQTVTQAVGPFDGVYLKGAGVVYTLRVPAGADLTFDPKTQAVGVNSTCGQCHQGIAPHTTAHFVTVTQSLFRADCNTCHTFSVPTVAAKPVSEWEQMRQAVRGEKPKEPEPKKADKSRGVMCEPGRLTELLTAQLAAHARNVRHLGANESITVVVTFDELPGVKGDKAGEPTAKLGLTPNEVQAFALGDLHLKQGKFAEAVEAYQKGLSFRFRSKGPYSFPISKNTEWKEAAVAVEEMTTSVRNALKSLATAYLQLGKLDDAKEATETAVSFRIGIAPTQPAAKPVGPAKLILSVSKADADAKDLAGFKKVVAVERVHFPAAAEKK